MTGGRRVVKASRRRQIEYRELRKRMQKHLCRSVAMCSQSGDRKVEGRRPEFKARSSAKEFVVSWSSVGAKGVEELSFEVVNSRSERGSDSISMRWELRSEDEVESDS